MNGVFGTDLLTDLLKNENDVNNQGKNTRHNCLTDAYHSGICPPQTLSDFTVLRQTSVPKIAKLFVDIGGVRLSPSDVQ